MISVIKENKGYKVKVENLAIPTKTINFSTLFEVGVDFENAYNTKGNWVFKKNLKNLNEIQGKEIDLKSSLENSVAEIPEIGYFTGYFNELVSLSEYSEDNEEEKE